MNLKKLLLVAVFVCGLRAFAPAQGLVGAPVDPRYGASMTIQSKAPSAQPSVSAGLVLLAILAALRLVRT
jgi:hypothetical protein